MSEIETLKRELEALGEAKARAEALAETRGQELEQLRAGLADRIRKDTEELKRSNDELNHFAYIASHDLKTPLQSIDMLSQWIEEDLGPTLTDESRQHMTLLRAQVRRMTDLLESLLRYSRVGGTEERIEDVDTAGLVREVTELLSPPNDIRVVVEGELPILKTARAPLFQVFHNLIDNAIKHHDREDGLITISSIPGDGGFHTIVVSDDGPGIPSMFRERVFQMFQRLRSSEDVQGSGMGLALVKKIVNLHGGTIDLDAHDGRGATFRFTWPRETKSRS